MSSNILSGKETAESIYQDLSQRIQTLKEKNIIPGLAVILVGHRPDSETYVAMKRKKCQQLGINSVQHSFEEDVTQQTLVETVHKLNNDDTVHGILIQLPLPKHINEAEVLNQVTLTKDVDGFHQNNVALLTLNQNPTFVPCTPDGCLHLIKKICPDLSGLHAVVVGRSRIVGMPMFHLLLQQNATVTICHSRTKNLPELLQTADIIVAACGRAKMIKGDWIKEGAVVIDVGINSVDDSSRPRGYRLVGDVDFDTCQAKAKAITPVPGGVGPMTIAMLMSHTVTSAEQSNKN